MGSGPHTPIHFFLGVPPPPPRSLSKKAVIDVEKKDENDAGENYTAREVKAVSLEKCDQEGSNQSVVVSTDSTRIVISYK